MKIRVIFLIFFSLFFFSCNHKYKGENKTNSTVLKKTETYFNTLAWTDSETILSESLPEPFKIEKLQPDTVAFYSDTAFTDSIFPITDELGILDYSAIDASLLSFFNNLKTKIKGQNIDESLCVKEKVFLPFLINFRLKPLTNINLIYYSRPEYKANKKAVAKFKCKMNQDESTSFVLLEITAIYIEDKWLIDSFDVIGVKNGESSK